MAAKPAKDTGACRSRPYFVDCRWCGVGRTDRLAQRQAGGLAEPEEPGQPTESRKLSQAAQGY